MNAFLSSSVIPIILCLDGMVAMSSLLSKGNVFVGWQLAHQK
jgi:hypothetical protein